MSRNPILSTALFHYATEVRIAKHHVVEGGFWTISFEICGADSTRHTIKAISEIEPMVPEGAWPLVPTDARATGTGGAL